MLKRLNRKVGTPNIKPTPKDGYYVVDSTQAACYPDWEKYAVAWVKDMWPAVDLARMYGKLPGKDYILLNESGFVVWAGGEFT